MDTTLFSPSGKLIRTHSFSATAKLQFDQKMNVALFQASSQIELTKKDDGTATADGMRIFKSGTFKDSMGFQHTWEPEHLQQMVFHFDLLKSKGTFPNVPWRVDHSYSVDKVAGYIDRLFVQENFLLADVTFTEPGAIEKIERGTYRNRSAEVGLYETNDEAVYWPVIMGVAFVDLAAVEGLYSGKPQSYTVLTEGETTVPDPTPPPDPSNPTPAPTPPTPAPTPPTPPNPAPPPAPAPPVQFTMGGNTVSDHAQVQQYITTMETRLGTLETFQKETLETARVNFVNQLVKDNKMAAPQLDAEIALVKTFSDEQWEAYKKNREGAAPAGIFNQHSGITNSNNTAEQGKEPTEVETLTEIITMHRRAGMTDEQIEKTPSAKKLAALTATK